MKRGILLFAHGARDPRWAAPFQAVAATLRPQVEVELGFLEFMTPDLRGAGEALIERGCTSIDVVPLFLGAGGHVRQDVPPLLDALRASHPTVTLTLKPAIGESPAVVEAMARVAME